MILIVLSYLRMFWEGKRVPFRAMRMLRTILSVLILLSTMLELCAQVQVVGKTPQADTCYAKGVSGHAATMLKNGEQNTLLMLGGCNFPDVAAVDGGVKRYYSEVYSTTYVEGKSIDSWRRIGQMPKPFAYAAYQKYNNTLIVAGGKSTEEDLSTVYRLSLTAQGELLLDTLPALPAPRSGMASALVGSRLYLIGGAVAGRLSNSMISLNLERPEEGWRDERPYYGAARLKLLAAPLRDETGEMSIYCFAAYSHVGTDEAIAEDFVLMHYKPQSGEWHQSKLEHHREFYNGYTFGGGCIYASSANNELILFGGVRSSRFMPAILREQHLRIAKREGNQEYVGRLQQEAREYLSQSPEWYEFCPTLYFVRPTTIGGVSLESSPHLAKADAALVEIKPEHWMILGGEIKPGVRTADICY